MMTDADDEENQLKNLPEKQEEQFKQLEKLSDKVSKIYLDLDLVVDTKSEKKAVTRDTLEHNAIADSSKKTKKKRYRKNRVEKRRKLFDKKHDEEVSVKELPPPTTITEAIEPKWEVKGCFKVLRTHKTIKNEWT